MEAATPGDPRKTPETTLDRRLVHEQRSFQPDLSINSRCLTAPLTGVQRYLLELRPYFQQGVEWLQPERRLSKIGGHLWEQFTLPLRFSRRLLWSPANTGTLAVGRQVVTIHDASTLDHPEWFACQFAAWYGFLLPRLCRKVRAIITVSHFSKVRLVETCGVSPEKVFVVHNGISLPTAPAEPMAEERDFILCVGTLEPRKNLLRLLAAWRKIAPAHTELWIAGASGRVFRETTLLDLPARVRLLGQLDDAQLATLYGTARAVVYPSLYEGFGFPPLEAMSHGKGALVSDIPSLREICGSAALYCDPLRVEDIAAKLDSVIRHPDKIFPDAARLKEHAAQYTWKRCARETSAVLKGQLAR
jgi:glycosyltransferase involved in cell wall biosynthesis